MKPWKFTTGVSYTSYSTSGNVNRNVNVEYNNGCMDDDEYLVYEYLPDQPHIIFNKDFTETSKIKYRIIMHYSRVYRDVTGESAIVITPTITVCGV
jgi:hypothetical protein